MTNNAVIKNGKIVGGKKLYLFRTNFNLPEKGALKQLIGKHAAGEMEWPEFDQDSPIWVAVP